MNVNIQSIHFKADERLEIYINEKLQKLIHFYDKITRVEVFLKLDHAVGRVHEKHVELKVMVPGNDIFSHDASDSFEHAFDLAFDHCKKQVVRRKDMVKGL